MINNSFIKYVLIVMIFIATPLNAMDDQKLKYGIIAVGAGCVGALCMNYFNNKRVSALEKEFSAFKKEQAESIKKKDFESHFKSNFDVALAPIANNIINITASKKEPANKLPEIVIPLDRSHNECNKFILIDDFEHYKQDILNMLNKNNAKIEDTLLNVLMPLIDFKFAQLKNESNVASSLIVDHEDSDSDDEIGTSHRMQFNFDDISGPDVASEERADIFIAKKTGKKEFKRKLDQSKEPVSNSEQEGDFDVSCL